MLITAGTTCLNYTRVRLHWYSCRHGGLICELYTLIYVTTPAPPNNNNNTTQARKGSLSRATRRWLANQRKRLRLWKDIYDLIWHWDNGCNMILNKYTEIWAGWTGIHIIWIWFLWVECWMLSVDPHTCAKPAWFVPIWLWQPRTFYLIVLIVMQTIQSLMETETPDRIIKSKVDAPLQ